MDDQTCPLRDLALTFSTRSFRPEFDSICISHDRRLTATVAQSLTKHAVLPRSVVRWVHRANHYHHLFQPLTTHTASPYRRAVKVRWKRTPKVYVAATCPMTITIPSTQCRVLSMSSWLPGVPPMSGLTLSNEWRTGP